MTITFKKAEKKQAKLRLAVTGPSGAGKTMTSLLIGRGLVGPDGKIAVVDTERDSASLYADIHTFDSVCLAPPYTTEKYIEAIRAAEAAGYDVVILDSISHAWAGAGGLLDQQDAIASTKGSDRFRSWGQITPKHQAFIDAMLACKTHLIATMRSKTEYTLVTTETGKTKPEKLGLAPVQRDGMDYEFTTVLDMDAAHICQASKDRTGLFADRVFRPDESTGRELREWLDRGSPAATPSPTPEPEPVAAAKPDVPAKTQPKKIEHKQRPKNVYSAIEVGVMRKSYEEKGWSTTIFDKAAVDGEVWDKDMIADDWKRRTAAQKQPVTKQTKPVADSRDLGDAAMGDTVQRCPKCGGTPMSHEQRSELTGMLDGAAILPENICCACGTAMWDEYRKKQAEPDEFYWNLVIPYGPCDICGKKVLRPDAKRSLNKFHRVLCPSCLKQELQIAVAKSAPTKDQPVCSKCGKPVSMGVKYACEFANMPILCHDCDGIAKKEVTK